MLSNMTPTNIHAIGNMPGALDMTVHIDLTLSISLDDYFKGGFSPPMSSQLDNISDWQYNKGSSTPMVYPRIPWMTAHYNGNIVCSIVFVHWFTKFGTCHHQSYSVGPISNANTIMVVLLLQIVLDKWVNPSKLAYKNDFSYSRGKFLPTRRQPYVVPLARQKIHSHIGKIFCTNNPRHSSTWVCYLQYADPCHYSPTRHVKTSRLYSLSQEYKESEWLQLKDGL